jgi:hypothetical protein
VTDKDDANVIPFGKHKGKTIEQIQVLDPQYLVWLIAQDWFQAKFIHLHQTIINYGAEPSETPEHNALQVLFLDDEFCLKVVEAVHDLRLRKGFEQDRQRHINYVQEDLTKQLQKCERLAKDIKDDEGKYDEDNWRLKYSRADCSKRAVPLMNFVKRFRHYKQNSIV